MINKVFSSYRNGKSKDATEDQQLYLELSNSHVACIVKSDNRRIIKDFELFTFNNNTPGDLLNNLAQVFQTSTLINHNYSSTNFFINNEQCLLLPDNKNNEQQINDYLSLLYGNNVRQNLFIVPLKNSEITVAFKVREDVLDLVQKHFPLAKVNHSYTALCNHAVHLSNANQSNLSLCFYTDFIIAVLVIGGKLQIIQTFSLKSDTDVLYYTFNICKQFNIDTATLQLSIAGLLETRTELVNDLKKYFNKLSFEEYDSKSIQINFGDRSAYHFTPFFNLAK